MNSLPEQFSAARQAQLDNGFNLMRSLGDQALDRTSRVFALQLDASRAAVEQTSNAMRQLLAVSDPRDLLALGSQSQQQLRTMLDYGRELFSIATAGMSVPVLGNPPAAGASLPPAQAAVQVAEQVVEQAAEAVAEPQAQVQTEPQAEVQGGSNAGFAQPVTESEESILSVVTSDITPDSAPTAMAKATSEALDLPVAPPHPVAASLPVEVAVEIELPKVEPVDATPPAAAVTGRPADTRGTKGRRRQG